MNTLHLVSHTHWDREWYQTFQQFRLKLVILVDGLLDILDHDSHYKHFMLDGQTIVLDDYLVMRPEMNKKLEKYIRSGRLIIGPWYILPDEFLVSPEATIRNLLQGDQTCRRFGPKMEIGYIPDPFGHIGQMPQILNGFGIHSAVFRRGLSSEPCELWWQSPDGSKVFVSYLRDGYDNAAGLPTSDPSRFPVEVCRLRDSLKPYSNSPHLLLMQGTDHMQPPPETSQAIAAAKGYLGGDELIQSTLQQYISAVQASISHTQIPTVSGELRSPKRHHLLPGVLSTRMWIKQRNHSCETLLEKWAEPFSTFAQLVSSPNSDKLIHQPDLILLHAWRLLMENHPHDSICGCSIDQVHDEMRSRFDQVDQIGEEITRQSLSHLVDCINTKATGSGNAFATLIVFNPGLNNRTDLINCEITAPSGISAFDLVDEIGNSIPFQHLGSGSNELINVVLDSEGLTSIIGNLHDGRVADLSIQTIKIERQAETILVEAVLAQGVSPNPDAWQQSSEMIKDYLLDPTVMNFHIRARNLNTIRVTFIIQDVPALGWKTIKVCHKPNKPVASTKINPLFKALTPALLRISQTIIGQNLLAFLLKEKDKPPYKIENEFFILTFEKSGSLTLEDKKSGNMFHNLNRFVDGGDAGDEYNYCPPANDTLIEARLKKKNVRRDNVQQILEAQLEILAPVELESDRKSRARRKYPIVIRTMARLSPGIPRVDIHTWIDNNNNDHRLRVHFPFHDNSQNSGNQIITDHDGHFEVIRRSIGVPEFGSDWIEDPRPEVPQRAFTDISNGQDGLMIANRGLPEVEVIRTGNGTEISLTLLRCVGWLSRDDFANRKGHAGPFLPTPGAQMQGKWEFDYSIIPHPGSWYSNQERNNPFQLAYNFNTPMRVVESTIHEGHLSATGYFVSIEPGTFVISSVKKTQDQKGWLVRGYNLTGEAITVNLKLWKNYKSAYLVNLAEETLSNLKPDKTGIFSFLAKPHEIISIKFIDIW